MKRPLVFIDTETTGLDRNDDDLVELSYWKEGDPTIRTFYFDHDESKMSDYVRKLTNYDERGVTNRPKVSHNEIVYLREVFQDCTLVAANPPFDVSFLERYGLFSFHFRVVDIETYAMAKLGLDYVPGMKDIHNILSQTYDFPAGDHSSSGDVLAMKTMFTILEAM